MRGPSFCEKIRAAYAAFNSRVLPLERYTVRTLLPGATDSPHDGCANMELKALAFVHR